MARKAREISSRGIYHVMMRGINRQQIFDDDIDCTAFLNLTRRLHNKAARECKRESNPWDIYAYALMGNHFHLLIKVRDVEIGEVVKQIASSYVFHFNLRHGRDGHLFRERFKSEPCEDNEYLATLLRYIHQNPVVAGRCQRVADYEFTSWHEYLGSVPYDMRLCNTAEVFEIIPFAELIDMVENKPTLSGQCLDYRPEKSRSVADQEISMYLQSKHNILRPAALQSMPREERNKIVQELKKLGAGIRQLQRLTGLGVATISRI